MKIKTLSCSESFRSRTSQHLSSLGFLSWVCCLLALLLPPLHAAEIDRTALVTFLNEKIASGAMEFAKDPTKQLLSPPEDALHLLAAQTMIQKNGDVELIKLLMQYQTTYLNPDNDKIARSLGVIFFEKTNAFEEAYELLGANQRLLLFPYLKFGWSKAIEGKNTSLPTVLEKQRRFDKIARGLINLRGYQDQPGLE